MAEIFRGIRTHGRHATHPEKTFCGSYIARRDWESRKKKPLRATSEPGDVDCHTCIRMWRSHLQAQQLIIDQQLRTLGS